MIRKLLMMFLLPKLVGFLGRRFSGRSAGSRHL